MIQVYFDTEFTELSRRGTLISIGLVDESNHHFYAEFNDYDDDHLNEFVTGTILPRLRFNKDCIERKSFNNDTVVNVDMRGSTEEIKKELKAWFKSLHLNNYIKNGNEDQIQFYTDCYAYDWMLFAEMMWGNGFDIPKTFSYIPIDLSTAFWADGIDPDYSREKYAGVLPGDDEQKHNSLWDAEIIKKCFFGLRGEIPIVNMDEEQVGELRPL